MIPTQGKLIVFDGNDGSGKATQAELLLERLKDDGREVRIIDFPRYYDNQLGEFIGECLRGDHGDFAGLDPKIASVLYAADRYESRSTIMEWLKEGMIVLCDRYVSANMIHQGGKIDDHYERETFIAWLEKLEYETFDLPKPDLVIYLEVPVQISLDNMKQKNEKYTAGQHDQHENNRVFLQNSHDTAQWLASQHDYWETIDCASGNVMRTRAEIHEDVYAIVERVVEDIDDDEL